MAKQIKQSVTGLYWAAGGIVACKKHLPPFAQRKGMRWAVMSPANVRTMIAECGECACEICGATARRAS